MTGKGYVFDAPAALYRPVTGGTPLLYVQVGAPNPPTNLAHTAPVAGGWTETWSAPATGPVPTGYQVFLNGTQVGGDLPATARSLAISGQAVGTYFVTVKALDDAGASVASDADQVDVSGPPPGVPDPPTIAHTAASITADGWTETWTPAATGAAATGFRLIIDGVQYGSDLASTARSVVVASQTSGVHSVVMEAFDSAGSSGLSNTDSVTILSSGVPPGLTAGRVVVGWFCSPGSVNNNFAHGNSLMDARNTNEGGSAWWQGLSSSVPIPGGVTQKRPHAVKQFNQTTFITNSALLSDLADADVSPAYFYAGTSKVLNNDWAGVAAGNYDSTLQGYTNIVLARITAGKNPFCFGFHHEPEGDNVETAGSTHKRSDWAAMNTYCSYFFAGWRGGNPGQTGAVYHPEYDVRAGLSWACTPNGYLFTASATKKAYLDTYLPTSLIRAFNANHGIIAPDCYDNNLNTGHRVFDNINAAVAWMRSHNVKHGAVPEMGCRDAAAMTQAWAALKNGVDVMRFAIYWDTGIGTETNDWRLIPNGYPADPATGPFVAAGDSVNQARLVYWRDTALVQSEAMGG